MFKRYYDENIALFAGISLILLAGGSLLHGQSIVDTIIITALGVAISVIIAGIYIFFVTRCKQLESLVNDNKTEMLITVLLLAPVALSFIITNALRFASSKAPGALSISKMFCIKCLGIFVGSFVSSIVSAIAIAFIFIVLIVIIVATHYVLKNFVTFRTPEGLYASLWFIVVIFIPAGSLGTIFPFMVPVFGYTVYYQIQNSFRNDPNVQRISILSFALYAIKVFGEFDYAFRMVLFGIVVVLPLILIFMRNRTEEVRLI